MAGGLAGLYYGYEKIPEEWLQAVVKREKLEEICWRADMFIKA
ncbi:MAG: ADP-ribosylglycohydrolase family protein [Oribacterium sp.]|nr:ADP-ribosylglycohydrolase family protein [Oribacterium sp.]